MLCVGVRPLEHLQGLPKPLWIVVMLAAVYEFLLHTGNDLLACRGIAETARNETVQLASRCSGKYNSCHWLYRRLWWEMGNTALLLLHSLSLSCGLAIALNEILFQLCS